MCRRLAEDPRVGDVAPDLGWDLPLRLLGGLHYLVLHGDASWDDVGAALVLQAFVWADQTVRLERLRRAIEVVRHDPPELVRGDYVEALPVLLADRRVGAQLVVFQTASTMYLDRGQSERLHAALREGAAGGEFAFVTTGRPPDDDGYALLVERYPSGSSQRLGVFDFHGEWLDWGR